MVDNIFSSRRSRLLIAREAEAGTKAPRNHVLQCDGVSDGGFSPAGLAVKPEDPRHINVGVVNPIHNFFQNLHPRSI